MGCIVMMRWKNFWMITKNTLIAMSDNRHCSECRHFWSNPSVGQMYCCKLAKRITARKKPCKYYQQNSK